MDWKTLFLSPEGRIGRRDFWIGFAVILVASIVLGLIPVLGVIVGLLLIWPQICIHAKRLHDMGQTAWLILIPAVFSLGATAVTIMVGGMAALSGDSSAIHGGAIAIVGLALLLSFLVGLAFLLWVGLSASQPGENRFGPPTQPLAPTESEWQS